MVTDTSTLHVETTLSITKKLRVEPGATLVIEAGADLTLTVGSVLDLAWKATVIVEGHLRLDGLLKRSPTARFIKRGDGTISATVAAMQ